MQPLTGLWGRGPLPEQCTQNITPQKGRNSIYDNMHCSTEVHSVVRRHSRWMSLLLRFHGQGAACQRDEPTAGEDKGVSVGGQLPAAAQLTAVM